MNQRGRRHLTVEMKYLFKTKIMKIKKTYTVIEAADHRTIIDMVNVKIDEGWVVQGGLSVVRADYGGSLELFFVYSQAMIKPQ